MTSTRTALRLAAGLLAGTALALPAAAQAQDDETYTIGVSIPSATHGWTGGVNFFAQQAAERLETEHPNLDFVVVAAPDAGQQANDLEDLMSIHSIDALVILPFESDPLTEPVRRVADQGVWVTVVDRGLAEPGIEDLYVAGNNPELGRVSADYMKERLPEGGNIVVLRGLPTVIDDERVDAFMQGIEGTGINVLDTEYANWNRDKGFEVMQDYLSRFPDIDAVWAQDDDIALGVIEAVRQAGREGDMFIVGGAGMKDIVQRVMDNDPLTPVDVSYPPGMIATAMEVTALRFTSGAPVGGRYIIGSPLITAENAEQFYFPDSPF